MAILNLDQLAAGMQAPLDFLKIGSTMEAAGVLHSLFYTTGVPGAAVAPSPGMGGAALTSYDGQIPYTNPSSGNGYLAALACRASIAGTLLLCDRLWHQSGIAITTTTGQTVTSVAWPARDRNGSTNGEGVLIGLEASAATGNGSPITNTTLTYTNSAGTGSRTGTIASWPTTAAAGTFVPFALYAGDVGVRSVQTVTLGTSYVSGTVHLVAYRVLASVGVSLLYQEAAKDYAALGLPRLYDNTVPFLLWLPTATTAATIQGGLVYAHG